MVDGEDDAEFTEGRGEISLVGGALQKAEGASKWLTEASADTLNVGRQQELLAVKEIRYLSYLYKLDKVVGSGATCQVRLATKIPKAGANQFNFGLAPKAPQQYAVKLGPKNQVAGYTVNEEQVKNEMEILRSISHAHIVRVHELLEDKQFRIIVQDYYSMGSL